MPRLVSAALLLAPMAFCQSEMKSALDTSVNPCVDFHQYACGGWYVHNPLPADRTRWGQYDQLRDRTQGVLKELLDSAARHPKAGIDQQIGDYYAACTDVQGIDKSGLELLRSELERIAKLNRREQLPGTIARLQSLGVPVVFLFNSTPDYMDASHMIAELDQGGLTLPDRDYYLKDTPRNTTIRTKFIEHVQRMFQLLNFPDASASAKNVWDFESALAKASLDRVSRRDPRNVYHTISLKELTSLAPSFDWSTYFRATKAPRFEKVNVTYPAFFQQVEMQITGTPLAAWKDYLAWKYVKVYADVLPEAFRKENFAFTDKILSGAKEQLPRWKRCVALTDKQLGEALGQKYTERYFTADTKAEVHRLVHEVEKTFEADVKSLDWMGAETKKRAIEKLHALGNKIGYPEQWRDYSKLSIIRGSAFANFQAAASFEVARDLQKIGKRTDKAEWSMTPPTVNAYYSSDTNSINFPAGRLQPPFYHPGGDVAANYGGIAGVIGHELTHGFDDEGRKRDKDGNLKDWWSAEDARSFEDRAQCFVDQYSAYTAIADIKLNGKLTLGENTADNGGVRLAYRALLETLAGKPRESIDGLTPEQRFFIAYAHTRCDIGTPESSQVRALTDPHSPGKYRINGVVSNMPEFQQAFGCKVNDSMVSPKACRVW